jgi:hypothetical protein
MKPPFERLHVPFAEDASEPAFAAPLEMAAAIAADVRSLYPILKPLRSPLQPMPVRQGLPPRAIHADDPAKIVLRGPAVPALAFKLKRLTLKNQKEKRLTCR